MLLRDPVPRSLIILRLRHEEKIPESHLWADRPLVADRRPKHMIKRNLSRREKVISKATRERARCACILGGGSDSEKFEKHPEAAGVFYGWLIHWSNAAKTRPVK